MSKSTGLNAFSSYHVGVAAEAVVAALFARCGYDVSVQYGANQPEYDLIVGRGEQLLKVSVKGSKDGSWGLTQKYVKDADYHAAVEQWLSQFKPRTVLCFVQFKGKAINEMPDAYLATPAEVARRLTETAKGRGDTILYAHKKWTDRAAASAPSTQSPTAGASHLSESRSCSATPRPRIARDEPIRLQAGRALDPRAERCRCHMTASASPGRSRLRV